MAVQFDADGESYTRTISLGTVTDWTVTCWLKLDSNTATTTVPWQIDNGSGGNYLRLNLWDGTAATFQTASGWFGLIGLTVTVGTWYYIGISGTSTGTPQARTVHRAYDSTTWGGGSPGQSASTFSAGTLRIGDGDGASQWMNGSLAGVKIWDANLSREEMMEESWTFQPRRTLNMRAFYPMLSTSTFSQDASGNGWLLSGGTGTALDKDPPINWSAGVPLYVVDGLTFVNKTLSDDGSGDDTLSVSGTGILSEDGSGDDTLTVTASVTLNDAGTGDDTVGLASNISLTEAGSGDDVLTASEIVSKTLSETGSASDVLNFFEPGDIVDVGSVFRHWEAAIQVRGLDADSPSRRWEAGEPTTEEG